MAMSFAFTGMGLLAFLCTEGMGYFHLPPPFLSRIWGGRVLGKTIQREYFGKDSFGKLVGIIMGFASIGGIIGPTLAGWVFDTLRSYHFIWLVFCGFSGLSIWLIFKIKPLIKIDV